MRIGIIGYGFVGQAVAGAHNRNVLMINDPYKFEEWENSKIEDMKEYCGWIYVCVPTPMKEDGSCDTSTLTSVLDSLKDFDRYVICKSTAPPEYYNSIMAQTGKGQKYNFKLIHMPEFLREKSALEDYMHPKIIVIGGKPNDVNFVAQAVLISDLTYKRQANIVKTDIGSAAAMKYYANSWLATKVIFNNQFAKWCAAQGVDWNNVAEVLKNDPRLGDTHYQVPGADGRVGYGGSCFPKDISAILKIAEDKNVDLSLLKHQVEVNEKLKQQQDEELAAQAKSALPTRRRREAGDPLPRTAVERRRRR